MVAPWRAFVFIGAVCLLASLLQGEGRSAFVAAAQPAPGHSQQVGGASSDFDGDSLADLVVLGPGVRVANRETGAVYVLYGSSSGISAERRQRFTREDF